MVYKLNDGSKTIYPIIKDVKLINQFVNCVFSGQGMELKYDKLETNKIFCYSDLLPSCIYTITVYIHDGGYWMDYKYTNGIRTFVKLDKDIIELLSRL